MAETGRALTTAQVKANDVKKALMTPAVLEQIKMALPSIGVNPERIARIAFTSVVLNPRLLECTMESLVRSVILSAQLGLLPDGRQAHLIPYWNGKIKALEAQFQPDYKGLATLILRSPQVAGYTLDAVFEKDEFELMSGTERRITHKPHLNGDRGALRLVYSIIEYKSGYQDFDYMTVSEVEKVRDDFSKRDKEGNFSDAWTKSFIEMAKKTVCKRHSKRADISMEMALAVRASDAVDMGAAQGAIAAEASGLLGKDDGIMHLLQDSTGSCEFNAEDFKAAVKDYNPRHVEAFVAACAESEEVSADTVKAEAMKDIEGFKTALDGWIEKNAKGKTTRAKKADAATGPTEAPGNGKAAKITPDQAQEINNTLSEFQVSVSGFKRRYDIENIADLPADKYEDAKAWMNLEIDKMGS